MGISIERVREARAEAALAHGRLLGNTSACAIAKSGQPYPAGKFWEGQTAALTELLRKPLGNEDTSDVAAATTLALLDAWRVRHVPGSPREAEAYRAGGVQALEDLFDAR